MQVIFIIYGCLKQSILIIYPLYIAPCIIDIIKQMLEVSHFNACFFSLSLIRYDEIIAYTCPLRSLLKIKNKAHLCEFLHFVGYALQPFSLW